jgi:hypothetical protein
MLKPSENDLLIHFDAVQRKLVVYRVLGQDLPAKVIHTEYSVDSLKAQGSDKASKLLGEDILLALQGTRDVLT